MRIRHEDPIHHRILAPFGRSHHRAVARRLSGFENWMALAVLHVSFRRHIAGVDRPRKGRNSSLVCESWVSPSAACVRRTGVVAGQALPCCPALLALLRPPFHRPLFFRHAGSACNSRGSMLRRCPPTVSPLCGVRCSRHLQLAKHSRMDWAGRSSAHSRVAKMKPRFDTALPVPSGPASARGLHDTRCTPGRADGRGVGAFSTRSVG
jgi:hypothetical protein